MQVHQKPRDMDNGSAERVVADTYWAKRMPRTAQKGAVFVQSEERATQNHGIEFVSKNHTKSVEKKPRIGPKGRLVVSIPINASICRQLDYEAVEDQAQRFKRQRSQLAEIANCKGRKRIADFILAISYVSNVSITEILGLKKSKEIVSARSAVCVLARLSKYSFPKIGLEIGRDHASVMNLVKDAHTRENVMPYVRAANELLKLELL